jgi:bacterioferritin
MIGNAKLLEKLNELLALERTGQDQYGIHRAKFANWQITGQLPYLDERRADEHRHQGLLEDRILFLEGEIIPQVINQVHVGEDVTQIFLFDEAAEIAAISALNEAIALAVSVGDEDTAQMLRGILKDETEHLDDIKARQNQQALVGGVGFWIAINIRECA